MALSFTFKNIPFHAEPPNHVHLEHFLVVCNYREDVELGADVELISLV